VTLAQDNVIQTEVAPLPPRTAPPAADASPARRGVAALGLVVAVVLGLMVNHAANVKTLVLYGFGLALGLVLFHSRFGFTSAWRQLVSVGQGKSIRAHMLMLGVGCVLFSIILGTGIGLSGPPQPSLQPIGFGVVLGAFLFGVGMQVGGSCASGTLFAVGSGQTAIVFTLGGFIAGSLLGANHLPFWTHLPTGPAVSLAKTPLGYPGAVTISLVVMAIIVAVSLRVERRRRPPAVAQPPTARGIARALRGSWPVWVGAVLLALLNAATMFVSGGAWGITSAFALWGAKFLGALGVDVSHWAYWTAPKNAAALHASVLADKTSVMDLGIIVGALIAAASAGVFVLHRSVPWKLALGAVLGGVLMGYGARIAGGCNIGAYFAGIASFSLHGWVWGLMAIGGTVLGLRLRPLFGHTNPKPSDSVC
jgi:uncharacterized membrane protein YedE/YeeE